MNVKECSLVIFLTALTMIGGGCLFYADGLSHKTAVDEPAKPEPRIMYRIMVEQGLKERQPTSAYTPQEQQVVNELKAVLSRWPHMMWLTSVEGRLMLVKMGEDGKPINR